MITSLRNRLDKKRRQRAYSRRNGGRRQAVCLERLEPRIVLDANPIAVPDPWYVTEVDTALTVGGGDTSPLSETLQPHRKETAVDRFVRTKVMGIKRPP